MHTSGKLPSPLTLATPYSARHYPCFMDENDEAQGQHLSRVFESVNDESWFGLKSKSSMTISLVDGQCASKLPRMWCLKEWMAVGLNEQNVGLPPISMYVYIYTHTYTSVQFSSVQFSGSVMSDSLQPHESQHARPPCPSPTPGVYPNPCPSSRWCHPALVTQLVKNPLAMQETWVRSLGWEDPLEKGMTTHSSILAWRIPWTV